MEIMNKSIQYEPHFKRALKPKIKPAAEPFKSQVRQYDKWYDKHIHAYLSELHAIGKFLPNDGIGIEVGLGTGRFAEPCGIKEGVEPSSSMREIAANRGINVIHGTAERLPYKDIRYDFVLMVTICYFNDVSKAFREAHRVLKRNGLLIIGFIDKDSVIGQDYAARKQNIFYQNATFYSYDKVIDLLKKTGFKVEAVNQTLFGPLNEISDLQDLKEGHGEGSFVVIKAIKKG
jgi:SAM-dependent methyltransferase